MRRRVKLAALAVGVLAVPTGLVVSTAGAASANASCGRTGPNLDNTVVSMAAGVSANMRSGSSTSCGVKGWADNRDSLDYYCYTWDANSASWTYLYNRSDGTYGWVKDSLLPNNGSTKHCGF
ncbi:SH3 domain-containing protein [Streptomyces sp. NPDC058001]|uniref:SH3 domain-containing protein n=1 Tax=Streptomyces sp. NPDC058001 TaxID=3346300 RepID=UPI0036E5F465